MVRLCLQDPDRVRASAKDTAVHVYYRAAERGFVCVVVAESDTDERFVVTAYFTASVKQGAELWTR